MIRSVCVLMLLASAACLGSARGEDKPYTVTWVSEPQTPRSQQKALLTLTIAPREGWVLKTQTPFKATLKAGDAIKLSQTRFSAKDFADPGAAAKTIKAAFEAAAAGSQRIDADLSFFLCTAEVCQRFTDAVGVQIDVKDS
jgi:hypothetical protein